MLDEVDVVLVLACGGKRCKGALAAGVGEEPPQVVSKAQLYQVRSKGDT